MMYKRDLFYKSYFVIRQIIVLKEKIEELHKSWKEVNEIKGPRDITAEFAVRSKMRDLNAACRVSSGAGRLLFIKLFNIL